MNLSPQRKWPKFSVIIQIEDSIWHTKMIFNLLIFMVIYRYMYVYVKWTDWCFFCEWNNEISLVNNCEELQKTCHLTVKWCLHSYK